MLNNKDRVIERGVEVKLWNPDHVYNINWDDYVPSSYINEFCDYTHSSLRWLLHKGRVDKRAIMYISNLMFVKKDYVAALQMLYNHPEKHSRQKFMIDVYYNKVDLDDSKIHTPSKNNLKLL